MPNKKPEDPTEILSWEVSLPLMDNKAIYQLLTTSINKGLIEHEKELTMTFVRDVIVGKKSFGDALSLPDGYGK